MTLSPISERVKDIEKYNLELHIHAKDNGKYIKKNIRQNHQKLLTKDIQHTRKADMVKLLKIKCYTSIESFEKYGNMLNIFVNCF